LFQIKRTKSNERKLSKNVPSLPLQEELPLHIDAIQNVCYLVGVVPMTIEKRSSVGAAAATTCERRFVSFNESGLFLIEDTVQKPAAVVSQQDRPELESAAASIRPRGPPVITRVE
jgi:hypothetical protein